MVKSISFVIPGVNLRPCGGVKIIFEFANRLAELGYTVNLVHMGDFTLRDRSFPSYLKRSLIRLAFLRNVKWFYLNPKINRFLVFGSDESVLPEADCVFATAAVTAAFVQSLPPSKGVKYYLIQDFENWDLSDDALVETYRFGMHNIAISHWLKQVVLDACGQCDCIINSIDLRSFFVDQKYGRNRNEIAVMYHEKPHKGFRYAWQAIDRLHCMRPDLRVNMFGAYSAPEWLPDWVNYTFCANDAELRAIYNASWIYICASICEGFALTCVEAMACGCALVVTDFAGSREYAVNEVNSLVVPTENVDAIVQAALRLLDDDGLHDRLTSHAVSDASRRDWDSSVNQLIDIIGRSS